MESTQRSFRVIAAYGAKGNDALALLKDTRLKIDAKKGLVCQAGARAGSQLFRTEKCQGKKVSLPQKVVVMIQETTRGSTNKKYGYSVEIGPVKKSNRPTGLSFEGTFQSTATKMEIEDIESIKPPKSLPRPSKLLGSPRQKPMGRSPPQQRGQIWLIPNPTQTRIDCVM
jgi:hypothetical protein